MLKMTGIESQVCGVFYRLKSVITGLDLIELFNMAKGFSLLMDIAGS